MKQKQAAREQKKQLQQQLEETDSRDHLGKQRLMGAISTFDAVLGNNDVASERHDGSIHRGEEETTNLYVGNVEGSVTEELLQEKFGKFGPVSSIKIMYPRSEQQRMRGYNCAFVQFGKRASAERAKAQMEGYELNGLRLKKSLHNKI